MNTCKATLRVLFSHRAYLLIYLVFVGIMMLSISWSMLSGTSDSAAAAFEPAKMRVAVIDRDSDRGRHRVIDAHIPVGFQRTGER